MALGRFRPILVVAGLAGLAAPSVRCEAPRDTLDVLFVGNSYVYFNDLPAMVEAIAAARDGPVVRAVAHTHGGMTLRRHLEDGHLPALLSGVPEDGGDWDVVVLQEQSALGAPYDPDVGVLSSPEAFYGAARDLAKMIRADGATPALYMTWAKEAFPEQSQPLSQAYRSIGAELDATVAPVGEAWAEVHRVRPGFGLHVADGSHPNPAGSYLAACVIYAALTGTSPVGAPRELTGAPWDYSGVVESESPTILVSLSAADAEFLQAIAWEVVSARMGDGRS